jgi:hypothetical protein
MRKLVSNGFDGLFWLCEKIAILIMFLIRWYVRVSYFPFYIFFGLWWVYNWSKYLPQVTLKEVFNAYFVNFNVFEKPDRMSGKARDVHNAMFLPYVLYGLVVYVFTICLLFI